MKKVFKPFFSYNIIKIENWLNEMGEKGYILKDVNLLTKVFTFEKTESKYLVYKICYENKGVNDISNTLKKDGWITILNINRWIFICNENKKEEIKTYPSRELLLKRNRNVKYAMWSIIYLYGFMYFPIFLILGVGFGVAFLGLIPVEYEDSSISDTAIVETSQPYMISFLFQDILFIAFIFAIFTIVKLNKLDKQFRSESDTYDVYYDKSKNIINDKNIIKKMKFGWFYSPDKTTEWLEEMEQKGFNFYKTNRVGSKFYFKKGTPRKMKYIADYQNMVNESYYEIYRQEGWNLNFKSYGNFMQWSIWSKEYDDNEPVIYTDTEDLLKNAKRVLLVHTLLFIPIILLNLVVIISDFGLILNGYDNHNLFGTFITLILIIEFSIFYKNIFKYYLRIKKKAL